MCKGVWKHTRHWRIHKQPLTVDHHVRKFRGEGAGEGSKLELTEDKAVGQLAKSRTEGRRRQTSQTFKLLENLNYRFIVRLSFNFHITKLIFDFN